MDAPNGLAGVIVAACAAFAGLAGIALSMRGRREAAETQHAANVLAERVQNLAELNNIIDRLREDVAEARAAVARIEADAGRRSTEQASRCRVQLDHALTTIRVLQDVVTSEVERAAAEQTVTEARRHIATDHPDDGEDEAL